MSEFAVEWQAEVDGECKWRVSVPADLRYLQGHFDSNPIVPAVAQLECLVRRLTVTCWPDLKRLHRVKQLKFRRPVRPGENLVLRLERKSPSRVFFQLNRGVEKCSSGILEFEAQAT